MSRQPLNIVVLGGSFAGLSVAHHFLDGVIHQLSTFEGAPTYRVVLVSPSTHIYWNICAPRALVSSKRIATEDCFVPIEPGFARHPFSEFTFMQGWATAIDTSARNVTIELVSNVSSKRTSGASKESKSPGDASSPTSPVWPVARNTEYRSNTADRSSKIQTLPYHALVLATGSSAHSPLYSLHGTHEETMNELQAFHKRLETANAVLIVGGGPSGCETAGQLANHFNHTSKRWKLRKSKKSDSVNPPPTPVPVSKSRISRHILLPIRRKRDSVLSDISEASRLPPAIEVTPPASSHRSPKRITLLSGSQRLLPKLHPRVGEKAEKQLKRLGVHVVHNIRQVSSTLNPDGTTNCILNNDMTITSDLLISAIGVYPNTRYLSERMLDEAGYVITDHETLRVYGHGIGERVYAVGDCADYSKNYVLDVYDSVPVLVKNLQNDLLEHEYRMQTQVSIPSPPGSTSKIHQKAEADEERPHSPTIPLSLKPKITFPAPPSPLSKDSNRPRLSITAPHRSSSRSSRHHSPSRSPIFPLSPNYHKALPIAAPSRPAHPAHTTSHFSSNSSLSHHPNLNPNPNSSARNPTTHPSPHHAPLLTPEEATNKIAALQDARFVPNPTDSQLMPITRFGGVGVLFNWRVPSPMVWVLKGRDYKVGKAKGVVGRGRNPYGVK